ncbi:MAG: cyclic pyranopterin monophosphate synthase MoaC [Halorhodospira sp.]
MSDQRKGEPFPPLSHLQDGGEAHIVDIGAKAATRRVAEAEGWIALSAEAYRALLAGDLKKGEALGTARIAGLMAAKRTADLIPLCHPLALTHAEVVFSPEDTQQRIVCRARTETTGPTGVEMEALTAVQVALLTIYDLCKGIDRGMEIGGVRLLEKHGGRSGSWQRR